MMRKLLYHNFRLLYRGGRRLRGRFTPAGLLFLGTMISSGLFGVNTRQTLAYQIFAVCAALILLSMLFSLRFRTPIETRRRLPQYGTMGQPLRYAVQVTNRSARLQKDLSLIDELVAPFPDFREFVENRDPEDRRRNWFDRQVGYPRLMGLVQKKRGAAVRAVALPDVPPGDDRLVEIEINPRRRGMLRFARTRVARPDPLGLFRAMQDHASPAGLLVLPKRYRVPRLSQAGRRRYQRGGMNLASSVGESQEFFSLRDYKPGDPLRAIHWRSFAKLGKPVVKEFHDEFFVRQGLVLDTFIAEGDRAVFEEGVSVAASFALQVPDQDALLDLMFVGTEAYRFTAGRGLGRAENLLEVLACVETCPDSFERLAGLVLRHRGELSAVTCVFLGWDEPRRALARALAQSGTPVTVFVIVADPRASYPAEPGVQLVTLPVGGIQEALDRAFPGAGTRR